MDYNQKCCALKLLPLDKQLLLNKCVLKQKVVHGKAPQYLKGPTIPSEHLHVHGNKQLLPRTRTDIFKMSFSFSGSLAWNSLPHHLRYPMEVKTFKRKAFRALAKPPRYIHTYIYIFICQTPWHTNICGQRWEAILMFHSIVRDKDRKLCQQTTTFEERGEPKGIRANRGPSAYQQRQYATQR